MDSVEPGRSGLKSMTRNQLYDLMEGATIDKKLDFMENKILCDYDNAEQKSNVKHKLSNFKYQFKKRWRAAHKTKVVFEKNNKDWLNGIILLPDANTGSNKTRSFEAQASTITSGPGRPRKLFLESSERTKRRKTEDLRSSNELAKLAYATQMKMRETGKADASRVMKELQKTPTRAKKYKEAYLSSKEPQRQLSILRTFSMIADVNLSRDGYNAVRDTNKSYYPCYSVLQKAKKEIYSPEEAYRVTATCAEVKLQALMDITAKRLLMHLGEDLLNNLSDKEKKTIVLVSKWGCDGSQQAQFKMKFENDIESDANIFQSY